MRYMDDLRFFAVITTQAAFCAGIRRPYRTRRLRREHTALKRQPNPSLKVHICQRIVQASVDGKKLVEMRHLQGLMYLLVDAGQAEASVLLADKAQPAHKYAQTTAINELHLFHINDDIVDALLDHPLKLTF